MPQDIVVLLSFIRKQVCWNPLHQMQWGSMDYWDMRRWKLSATAFTGIRLHGLKIEQNANGSFNYIYVECDDKDRNFPTKMYRFPMPQAELDNNGAVTQYAEWQ